MLDAVKTPDDRRAASPSRRSLHGLDGLNFFLADVQTGVGPFLAIYLAKHGWNEALVGTALTIGGMAGIVAQTPAGALVDRLRSKRALVAGGVLALAIGAMGIALYPTLWPVMIAQVFIGASSSLFIPAICGISLGLVGAGGFDRRQGEMLSKGQGRASMLFMSACVVTTQLVITFIASWSGARAGKWGRKPLLLMAFAVLPIRGILYTLTANPVLLVAIQVLDGVGAGIFGVVSVLVISDLTQGSGRFNLALGAITTAVGIGAALSQSIAGGIVHRFGYPPGFLFLAAVALAALALLYFLMPETRLGAHPGASAR